MKLNLKRFIIRSLLIAVVLWALARIFFVWCFPEFAFPGLELLIGGIWLLGVLFYSWLVNSVDRNPRSFNTVYMAQTTIKLLLYLFCLVIYMFSLREFARPFAICFLVVYVVFTVFEVVSILKFIKSKADKPSVAKN